MEDYAKSIASRLKIAILEDLTLKEDDICVVVIPVMNKAAAIVVHSERTVSYLRRETWKNSLANNWEGFIHLWPGFKSLGMKILIFGEQTDINPFSHPI